MRKVDTLPSGFVDRGANTTYGPYYSTERKRVAKNAEGAKLNVERIILPRVLMALRHRAF